MKNSRLQIYIRFSLTMLIILLYFLVYQTTVYGDDQFSVKDSKETVLIPKPTGYPIEGLRGRRDTMLLLHMKSRPVMETEEEQKLEFYNFNPGKHLDKILKPEFLPAEIRSIFKKKQVWYPYFLKRKLQKKGHLDTAVARYSAKGYTIQVIETRSGTEVFVRNDEKPLNTTLSAMTEGVPECFLNVFNKDLFEDANGIHSDDATFADGEILRVRSFSRPSEFISELYIPHFGAIWTNRVMVLGFPKDYRQAANPTTEYPMFIRADQPQPYEKELSELEKLSAEGPVATEKIAVLLRKALSDIPDDPEERQKQIFADPPWGQLAHRNRSRLLRDGYAILTNMVKLVANEDTSLRHECWSAAASVMPTMGSLISEASALARAIFSSMASSGKPEDVALMKELMLNPRFADSIKDGIDELAKAIGSIEMQKWAIEVLSSISDDDIDNLPKKMVNLIRCTPGQFDDSALKAVDKILKDTNNEDVTIACLELLARYADAISMFRTITSSTLKYASNSKDEDIRKWSAIGLGKCGDLESLKSLYLLLKDQDRQVRLTAATSICKLLDRQILTICTAKEEDKWFDQILRKTDRLFSEIGRLSNIEKPIPIIEIEKLPYEGLKVNQVSKQEITTFSMEKLQSIAESPDKAPTLTVLLLQATPTDYYNDRCPKLMKKIFISSKNRSVQLASVQVLKRCADSVESFNELVRIHMQYNIKSEKANVRQLIAIVLAKIGDLRVIKQLLPLLSDPDKEVRVTAAQAICCIMQWPTYNEGASKEKIRKWIDNVKEKATAVHSLMM